MIETDRAGTCLIGGKGKCLVTRLTGHVTINLGLIAGAKAIYQQLAKSLKLNSFIRFSLW
jgi:hypothetical protein